MRFNLLFRLTNFNSSTTTLLRNHFSSSRWKQHGEIWRNNHHYLLPRAINMMMINKRWVISTTTTTHNSNTDPIKEPTVKISGDRDGESTSIDTIEISTQSNSINRYPSPPRLELLDPPSDLLEEDQPKAGSNVSTAGAPGAVSSSDNKNIKQLKSTKLIFEETWRRIESQLPEGPKSMILPSEIVFLMGSPASGKGTHAHSIMQARGITNASISISQLLKSNYQTRIDKGEMIEDEEVLECLLRALLLCDPGHGALVDGFPRTETQVEFLRHLHDRLSDLRKEYFHTAYRNLFRRPIFRICVLFVDEKVSLERQLMRGRKAREHNERVKITGTGHLVEERPTDFDIDLIKRRYEIFTQHYGALLKLREHFNFHLIDASRSKDETLNIILKEFDYQSSIELDQDTFDMIQAIPIASELAIHARQDLVRRLENYQTYYNELFSKTISLIEKEFIPVISKHTLSGASIVRSENALLEQDLVADMILDLLSERGYHVTYDCKVMIVPERVEKNTLQIITRERRIHMFKVNFNKHVLRHFNGKK